MPGTRMLTASANTSHIRGGSNCRSKCRHAQALADCVRTAERARAVGLGVNAGHDLSQRNLGALKHAIPFLAEVSIGHALIGEALYDGLAATVRAYLAILAER